MERAVCKGFAHSAEDLDREKEDLNRRKCVIGRALTHDLVTQAANTAQGVPAAQQARPGAQAQAGAAAGGQQMRVPTFVVNAGQPNEVRGSSRNSEFKHSANWSADFTVTPPSPMQPQSCCCEAAHEIMACCPVSAHCDGCQLYLPNPIYCSTAHICMLHAHNQSSDSD